ncbi:uncharacterized protein BJ212DRAFT_1483811 [Suillus subaureus]|uniref:F-box domain-containing protein n=1 Tax=Suillus subaureus TaxID=48587 RepID=A0A9P7JAF7_9AGAM|nr:uncharacterized protein BJ212DRAFT_1483811 [Suillus subaureus]KAG1811143.1 hypothetical protein BJ212DRAFT_1483811 [Suillus subaureus]
MHHALLVPDILDHIFTFIKAGSEQISRRTLAALARTCSALSDASLDALWGELRSLYPLVSCIYDTNMKLSDEDPSEFDADAGPDLSVFHKYAYRVHKIELSGYEGGWRVRAVPDDLGVFHSCSTLATAQSTFIVSSHIKLSVEPKIHPVTPVQNPGTLPGAEYAGINILSLRRMRSNSRKLLIPSNLLLEEARGAGLQILRLRVDSISDLNLPANSLSFPSLRTLQFQANSLATVHSILQAVRNLPKSMDIFLPVYRSGGVSVETVEPILQPIGQNVSCGNLEEFRMNVPLLSSGVINSSNVLRPLFLCCNLRVLRIMMTPLFLPADDDLRAMASAWPLLEELELFDCRNLYPRIPSHPLPIVDLPDDDFPPLPPLPVGLPPHMPFGPMMSIHLEGTAPFADFNMTDLRSNQTPEITFHGLISLLELCPNLRFFNLAIDATKLDGLRGDKPGGGVCNRLVKYPRLIDSHISDPEAVARILLDILPELETIWGEGSPGPFTTMFNSTLPQGWDQVHEIMLDSKAARVVT